MNTLLNGSALFYILLSVAHLVGTAFQWSEVQFYTKPLLMASLAWYFFRATGLTTRFAMMVFVALLFSMCGDTLLMFVPQGEQWFLLGLGNFLLAHLCYSIGFLNVPSKNRGLVLVKPLWSLPLLVYFGAMMYVLIDHIPVSMRYPVVFYSYVITMMALAAMNLQPKIPQNTFTTLITGVVLFMISDSMIAFNKFMPAMTQNLPIHFLIMGTYLLGQFLIAHSCIYIHQAIKNEVIA
jgi:uncharacterized membrane protein YhhN